MVDEPLAQTFFTKILNHKTSYNKFEMTGYKKCLLLMKMLKLMIFTRQRDEFMYGIRNPKNGFLANDPLGIQRHFP